MFTGIVQKTAEVAELQHRGASAEITVSFGKLAGEVRIGDSVLVDGVCLTVTTREGERATFDVSSETLSRTTLGTLRRGGEVNVELAMLPTDRFGGHFVSGHIDGTGAIAELSSEPGQTRLRVNCARELTDMMIHKGSVAVDGISLTVAELRAGSFSISIVPHTLAQTTLEGKSPGDAVNIECDMIGKWVRRFVRKEGAAPDGVTLERLREEGF
jgi:riboflavin synthase